mmetsp:Transcript_121816/g.316157  ORF Transcript_121816/g.316157 Transcript_121816/m.316157 type:complete len:102 (-) Transcript_121816:146-451(-)
MCQRVALGPLSRWLDRATGNGSLHVLHCRIVIQHDPVHVITSNGAQPWLQFNQHTATWWHVEAAAKLGAILSWLSMAWHPGGFDVRIERVQFVKNLLLATK